MKHLFEYLINGKKSGKVIDVKLKDIKKDGEWFYYIDKHNFLHCQLSDEFPFDDGKGAQWQVVRQSHRFSFVVITEPCEWLSDDGCTYCTNKTWEVDKDNKYVTTSDEEAEKYHKLVCPRVKLKECPYVEI